MEHLVAALDIGNSMTHAGIVDMQKLRSIASAAFPTAEIAGLLPATIEHLASGREADFPLPLHICCVAAVNAADIARALHGVKCVRQAAWVRWHDRLEVKFTYDTPETLGADRIANCLYAHAALPGKTVVIIDAGTAVTVDVLSESGEFKGGAILPGVAAQLDSLHRMTARLPDIPVLDSPRTFPAMSTVACMSTGAIVGLAEALNGLVRRTERQFGGCTVIACGGGWKPLESAVDFPYINTSDCTLVGTALYREQALQTKGCECHHIGGRHQSGRKH